MCALTYELRDGAFGWIEAYIGAWEERERNGIVIRFGVEMRNCGDGRVAAGESFMEAHPGAQCFGTFGRVRKTLNRGTATELVANKKTMVWTGGALAIVDNGECDRALRRTLDSSLERKLLQGFPRLCYLMYSGY